VIARRVRVLVLMAVLLTAVLAAPGQARGADAIEVQSAHLESDAPADGWLLAKLSPGTARTVDELAADAGVAVPLLLSELLRLELEGAVERLPDGRFARIAGNGAG